MKLGILGLGSIGQRHVRCLKTLGYDDIIALRTKKGTMKTLPQELDFITEFYDIDEFYSQELDGIIISNILSIYLEFQQPPEEDPSEFIMLVSTIIIFSTIGALYVFYLYRITQLMKKIERIKG